MKKLTLSLLLGLTLSMAAAQPAEAVMNVGHLRTLCGAIPEAAVLPNTSPVKFRPLGTSGSNDEAFENKMLVKTADNEYWDSASGVQNTITQASELIFKQE